MIVKVMKFLHDNWVGVIFMMMLILFSVWLFAFFANGLLGCHFELASCWAGVGAIATAAAAGWGKWVVDSRNNSLPGEMPNTNNIKGDALK